MKTSCDARKISPTRPSKRIIDHAVRVIRNSGVIAFPTTGLYGLGADAMNPAMVERIFAIKGRPPDKPILVLIPSVADLGWVAREVPSVAERLMQAFWPGGLTIILKARKGLPSVLTAGTGKIGVRIPVHPVARALVAGLNGVLTGTSANVSGQPGCSDVSSLDRRVADQLDLILDAGPLAGGPGSTVVDVSTPTPTVLREGAIARKDIDACLSDD